MRDIRQLYLDFFAQRGHKIYDSMPLVPDDASLLFTNAGMVQFKDIFTGKIPIPTPPKATSSQLCIRAGGKHNDLENVGYTARHHTLFEMLGNFSFGNYFKKDAIAYAWEFVTQVLGFDKSLLYVTIHESDDESFSLWCEHISPERIKRMGDKDNFWQMGDTGPCGPCSEIYVDQGAEFFHSSEDYFGGEGDRFLEIWNLVFMQYEQKDGIRTPLPKPSIDTGMGLERVVALLEKKLNNFDTSLFAPLMKSIENLTNKRYYHEDELLKMTDSNVGELRHTSASFRVIADHARSVAFLLAQGVNFDREGRGYVLRRILRRAVRHGYLLG
ncbi:alanine--tRNA ligase-related protein, partial [uncultured Helicobacter sp.]